MENDGGICDKFVPPVMDIYNINNIVIGHTVQDNINAKCDNKIWRVDVGISSLFGTNNTQILEILDNGEPLPRNKFKPIRVIN